jgi:hypothetical protein
VSVLTIGALAIRAVAVKRGRFERLNIEELEAGRATVWELVVGSVNSFTGVYSEVSSKRANGPSQETELRAPSISRRKRRKGVT